MRIALADDSVLFREGLARLLIEAGHEISIQATTADELHAHVDHAPPDLAVIDIRMPPTHTTEGLKAAQRIRQQHPGTAVLVLSQYVEAEYALTLVSTSATSAGYLLKDRVTEIANFTEAVRRVGSGELVVDPALISQLLQRQRARDPLGELSDRERDVLALMAEGRSNQSIGETLFLSSRTVEAHVHSIFTKLGLAPTTSTHRRVLAVLTFLRSDTPQK